MRQGSSHEDALRCSRIMSVSFVFVLIFGAWGIIRWLVTGTVDVDEDMWSWGLFLSLAGLFGPVVLPFLGGGE